MSVAFLLTSLIVVVTPGTGVLYTLAAALTRGDRASVIAAFGCTLGIVPQMLAAVFGLGAVLNASAVAFQTIKYFSVAYLLYLAWSTLKERCALKTSESATPGSAGHVILTAVLINLLNPLSAVFMAMTFVVFVGYGLLAAVVRAQIMSRPRVSTWMRRAFAGAFIALAARLALAER